MAQVMMLIGLLLMAFLILRAVRWLRSWVRARLKGPRRRTVDRPNLAIERNITEEQQKLAMLRQQKQDLEQRIEVLERLLIEPAPSALKHRSSDPSQ